MIDLINNYREFFLRGVFESIFLFIFFILIVKKTNIVKIFKSNKNTNLLILTFFLIFFMQAIDRFQYFYPQKFDLYPFARFAMYQAAPDGVELTSYRFCILDETDNCRIINISKVYSTIGLPSLSSRMKYLIDEFPSTEKEIEYWLSSLERLTIENDKKIVFQKIELENSKVITLNMVEVNIEK